MQNMSFWDRHSLCFLFPGVDFFFIPFPHRIERDEVQGSHHVDQITERERASMIAFVLFLQMHKTCQLWTSLCRTLGSQNLIRRQSRIDKEGKNQRISKRKKLKLVG